MKIVGLVVILVGVLVLLLLFRFLTRTAQRHHQAEDQTARWHPYCEVLDDQVCWSVRLGTSRVQTLSIIKIKSNDPDFDAKYVEGQDKATAKAAYLNVGRIVSET